MWGLFSLSLAGCGARDRPVAWVPLPWDSLARLRSSRLHIPPASTFGGMIGGILQSFLSKMAYSRTFWAILRFPLPPFSRRCNWQAFPLGTSLCPSSGGMCAQRDAVGQMSGQAVQGKSGRTSLIAICAVAVFQTLPECCGRRALTRRSLSSHRRTAQCIARRHKAAAVFSSQRISCCIAA